MATAAAAYKQLQRLPDDLGRAIEGVAGRQQADKARLETSNQGLRDKIGKIKSDYAEGNKVDPTAFEYEATSHTDFDEILSGAAKNGFKTAIDIRTQANKLFNSGNREEADKLHAEADRIETTFKNFKTHREEFATIMTKNSEKMQNGKILDKSWAMFQDAINRNEFTMEYQDGDFLIRTLNRDKNGEIVRDENGDALYEEKTMGDIRKGLDMPYEYEDAYGKGGLIDNIMVNFGKKTFDEESGNYMVTSTEWHPTNEASLKNYIESVVGDDKEPLNKREMYKWLMNATGEEKFDKFTDEDKEKVKSYIREGVASQFPESVAKEIRGLTADEKLGEAAKNRNLKRELQDDAQEFSVGEAAKNRAADMEELKAKLKAKANADKNKDKVKAMGKNATEKMAAVGIYQLSKDIAKLPPDADEIEVQEIIDKSEYGFVLGGDLDALLGFGNTEYDIKGGAGGLQIKDVFGNFRAFVKASNLKLEDTDLKEIMANPSKYKVEDTDTDDKGFDPNNF